MREWTKAQQNAIDARNCNVLVSAGAGSGKTAVLVERVIKKITDKVNPVDIDKLLIVTFTNAAANEMKSRIAKALNDIIKEYPNDTNAKNQLSLLPGALICTIDSFCINLVRENFFKLDIQQDFKILDDAQGFVVEDDAINSVIDEYYENDSDEFKRLVELLSSTKNEKSFISTIKRINDYIMVQPFPIHWLKKMANSYNPSVSIEESVWFGLILEQVSKNLKSVIDLIKASKDAVTEGDELFDELNEIISADAQSFSAITKATSWDDMKNAVDGLSFVDMTRKKREYTAKAIVAQNRDAYKAIFQKEIRPLFSATSAEYKEDCERLYPSIMLLIDIVAKYNDKMLEMKKELNSYTFADIEHFAINLLFSVDDNDNFVKTELAREYEDVFDEILVDEYQDTNRAQDKLFEMLSNGKNRFMVGDVKQSIYRFRLAMPQIFTEKKNLFDFYDESNSVDKKIILDKNFRSRNDICEYVNHIFSTIMTEQVGELDYNEEEFLFNGADFADTNIPSAQINIVKLPEDADADEYEAHQIARLIQKKIASKEQIKDGDEYRDIQYSDFAILLRSASTRMPIYNKVFAQYSIPTISNNKANLFDNNEVAILLSLLRTIDNPTLDIPLLATLMSVFYGYNADQIASAKIEYKSNTLYGSIVQDEQFKAFVDDVDKYRKYSSSMSVEAFLRQIINDTSYLSVISAMGNAELRRLNVMRFVDIAKQFDSGENVGITAFIRYVDSIIKAGVNVEGASLGLSGSNAVQIMTIHKSKGLEFPVCILAGSSHKYNNDELKGLIQLHLDYGLGLKVYNEEQFYRYNTIQYNCLKELNSLSIQSENLRVLYVALTRAKEQFITFYSSKDPVSRIEKLGTKIFDSKIIPSVVKHINCDGDIILLLALLNSRCDELRGLCDNEIIPNTLFNYDISVNFLDDLADEESVDVLPVEPNLDTVDKISKRLSFCYDRSELSHFTSKRTASSLDDKERGFKYFASSMPSFLNKVGLSPAEKGTAMHTFMQFCDYENAKANLDAEIDRLLSLNHLTNDQANALDKSRLSKLFQSSLAERMFNSNAIYREIKVSSFVPANELEETDYTDNVLVQGIADCVFEENGELVLVDYKTDRVDSEDELLDLYKNQIAFYKNAVSKTLGKPVKQALLYSFSLNKECIYK